MNDRMFQPGIFPKGLWALSSAFFSAQLLEIAMPCDDFIGTVSVLLGGGGEVVVVYVESESIVVVAGWW